MSPQRLKELQEIAIQTVSDVVQLAANRDQSLLYLAVVEHYITQLINERMK